MKSIFGIIVGLIVVAGALLFILRDNNAAPQDTVTRVEVPQATQNNSESREKMSGDYIVDPTKSTVKWIGRAMGRNHEGYVHVKNGVIVVRENVPVEGRVVADMVNIVNEDLEGEEQSKLIAHLKSDDFFSVADHPEAILTIKSMEPVDGEDRYGVVADLTVKGITKEIIFDADVEEQSGTVSLSSQFDVDRTEWDITFGTDSMTDQLRERITDDIITFDLLIVGIADETA